MMATPLAPLSLVPNLIGLIWECQDAVDATKRVQKGEFKDLYDTIQSLRGPLNKYRSLAARGDIPPALIGPLATLEGHLKQARDLLKKFDKMSIAYRLMFHRNIAADLRAIKSAISSDMEVHKFAGWLVQEERARAAARELQELKEMVRRLQLDSASSTSASGCSSPPRSESSILNELDFKELAQERDDVIPAEISALREAGDVESANSLARLLDRLESTRDEAPHTYASQNMFHSRDNEFTWGGQAPRLVQVEQPAVGGSPAERVDSRDGPIGQTTRGREETRGGRQCPERESGGRREASVGLEDGGIDWLDPHRWGFGAPPGNGAPQQAAERFAEESRGVGPRRFAAGGEGDSGADSRWRVGETAGRRERTGDRAAERLVGSVRRREGPGKVAAQRLGGSGQGREGPWDTAAERLGASVGQRDGPGHDEGLDGSQVDLLDATRWGFVVPN